jgi:hypothetical protein
MSAMRAFGGSLGAIDGCIRYPIALQINQLRTPYDVSLSDTLCPDVMLFSKTFLFFGRAAKPVWLFVGHLGYRVGVGKGSDAKLFVSPRLSMPRRTLY